MLLSCYPVLTDLWALGASPAGHVAELGLHGGELGLHVGLPLVPGLLPRGHVCAHTAHVLHRRGVLREIMLYYIIY